MRMTIDLDEELLATAKQMSESKDTRAVLDSALRALIERESARRLARRGGSTPELRPTPRRRPT
ncbi:MAG: type II toxin-antitoxin system VapB family antitoxin [Pseudomonadales bacterium]|jgi:Arc/MetJ family transcription regulator|nr:type II toxin-antitoxin system VapB family antitoxin [Pseudomonadales bacterium]